MAEAAHFDEQLGAWVLSRYDDVLAALREPTLVQTGSAGPLDEAVQAEARAQVLEALGGAKVEEWRARVASVTSEFVDRIPVGRPFDLVGDFLQPWAKALAESEPDAGKSLRTGVAETLPSFLAGALLDLLQSPAEFARLRGNGELMARAVEELLRHAGLVHTLVRTATADVDISGVRIGRGEKVVLKIAEADLDNDRFSEAEHLDVSRRLSGHVALGAGAHSCAGAVLVRMATASVIGAFATRFSAVELSGPVEWHRGATLKYPVSMRVTALRETAVGDGNGRRTGQHRIL